MRRTQAIIWNDNERGVRRLMVAMPREPPPQANRCGGPSSIGRGKATDTVRFGQGMDGLQAFGGVKLARMSR